MLVLFKGLRLSCSALPVRPSVERIPGLFLTIATLAKVPLTVLPFTARPPLHDDDA